MNSPVLSALIPVMLLIAIGYVAGLARWIRAESIKDLSNLVFMVLTPALLFRTMSTVHIEQLDFKPVVIYFVAAGILFSAMLVWHGGVTRRSTVLALAATFSNTLAIGAPLVSLAYGELGLVTLFTLISVHALILLTMATVILELAVVREEKTSGALVERHMMLTVLGAVRNGIFHPVPLPIIVGLLFAQTGLVLPVVVEKPLLLLGSAFGPLALLLAGVTLAKVRVGVHLRGALGLTMAKNLVFPALVAVLGLVLGLSGLPLTIMVVAASLPIGANVFMFSQRYQVAEDLVTASVAVSTGMALLTVSFVMALTALL